MTEREYYRKQEEVDVASAAPDDAIRDVYQERVYGPEGEQVVQSEHVSIPSDAARRAAVVHRISQAIYYVFGVIAVLLALRFVLLALGANEFSPFVNFIYSLSRPFVLPFQGIFGEPRLDGSVIEWASLVGIAIYLLVAYGLARLVELIYAPARSPRHY